MKQVLLKVVGMIAVTLSAQVGLASDQIIGGTSVSDGQTIARRTVALYFNMIDHGQQGAGICTGSIIDSSHILTAAHCVQGYQSGYVVFSATQVFPLIGQAVKSGVASTRGLVQAVSNVNVVPGFPGIEGASNGGEFVDLAIISFAGGLPQGYEAAHFLPKKTILSGLSKKTQVTLSGYGMVSAPNPSIPEAPTVTGFPTGVGFLRQVAVTPLAIAPQKIDLFLIGKKGHISCEGDSGGPAMIQMNGEIYVIGVDSRGDCSQRAIYTIVDKDEVTALAGSTQVAKN